MTNHLLRSRTGWAFLAAVALALLLPGCAASPQQDIALNRIQVLRTADTHTVFFAPGSAALAPSEEVALRAYLEDSRSSVSAVSISSGSSPIAQQRAASVSRALTGMGTIHTTAAPNSDYTADAVVVAATRQIPVPPACPNWNPVGGYDGSNAPSTNLGCANSTNLFLMVADPRDLVRGRALAPADAEPGMRAVEAYRTGNQAVNPQLPSLNAGITSIGNSSGGGGGATGGGGGQ